VIHSRDDQEVGVAYKVKSPKKSASISQTMMGEYWLGKTKPKQTCRSTQNAFKELPWNFIYLFIYLMQFLLTD